MTSQLYRVTYWTGDREYTNTVSILPGYSTFEDIRKILATLHYGDNSAEGIARISVNSVTLQD